MGMFDRVIYPEAKCECGAPIKELQSKSGYCELQDLSLDELQYQAESNDDLPAVFYGTCENGHFQNYKIVPATGIRVERMS